MPKRKILRRTLGGILLSLYVLIALLNTSLVQSYLGAAVGSYFSKEWGGKVSIGAISVSPLSHVMLNKIELISPTNDTIYIGDRITCRFKQFPFHKGGLKFDRVLLRNGRYHFHSIKYPSGQMGTNLDFIIKYFAPKEPKAIKDPQQPPQHFVVEVGELRLRNIDYIQDLPEHPGAPHFDHGVKIPHMRFWGTTAHFRKVRVDNDSITCRIVSLTTTEDGGQHVVDLSADVEVSPHVIRATNLDLQTDDSRVFLDAQLLYHGWKAMGDYCRNVRHEVVLKEGTEVNLRDAAFWAPVLWGVNCKVAVKGHAYGPVADLHADKMVINIGQSTHLLVDGSITGLPHIQHTTLDVAVTDFHANYADLAPIQYPDLAHFVLPAIVEQMGIIDLSATMQGGMSNCQAMVNVNSLIGDLEAKAAIAYDSAKHDYAYFGVVDSRTLGVRTLLPNEWVSRTGMHLSFEGVGFSPQSMVASLEGRLYDTHFRGNELARTILSADIANQEISADIQLNDTLINLDLSAAANLDRQTFSAVLSLQHAQLSRLNLVKSDSNIAVTTQLDLRSHSFSLDSLTGHLSLQHTRCDIGSRHIAMRNLALDAQNHNGYRDINLSCDWAQAAINGYFEYDHVPLIIRDFCLRYVPTYYNPYFASDSINLLPLAADNISIDIEWLDTTNGFSQLVPAVAIAPGTTFHGSYNYTDALKMVLRSQHLTLGGITLHDVGVNTSTPNENFQLRAKAGSLSLADRDLIENIRLNAGLGSHISTIALQWDDDAKTVNNQGDLEFFLTSTPADNKIMVTHPTFYTLGQRWTVVCPNGILFNRDRLLIDNLKVYGLGQSANIMALLSGSDNDYIKAAFSDFVLDDISPILLPGDALKVQGTLDGLFLLKGLHSTPYFDASLMVNNCFINGQPAGQVTIDTKYKASEKKLMADLVAHHNHDGHDHKPLEVHGDVVLNQTSPLLNFNIALDEVDLKTLRPTIATFSSDIQGMVSGDVSLQGSLQAPLLHGRLNVGNGLLSLTPTGVTYYFNDAFEIDNNKLTLTDFAIHDKLGNTVMVNGHLMLTANQMLDLDLDIDTKRVLALDKEMLEGETFYGRLLVQAKGSVTGPVNNLAILASASTLPGSEIFVPIDNTRQVQENEFITFIQPNRPARTTGTAAAPSASNSNVDIRLNLQVTPGLKLHLPMDFDQLEANVNAVGRGDIQVVLRNNQPLDILGDYEFVSGSFSLALMQLITRNFTIEEGSTLNFPGNINDARFNINAVYNIRANLASLMSNYTSNTNDSYVQVQDVIKVSGTLQDPSIKFDIRLPNSEQSVSEQVFSYLDRNNELEMLNQSVALLVLGQFTPTGAAATSNTDNINSVSLVANTAASILTGLVKVVDVNFKYQASNSNLNPMGQFDLGISKSWNKFYFESIFGYGNVNSLDIDQANTLVGDVKVGYRFNPYFDFYGFHRTNTSYYTRTELPYKQGIGVELSKDFDNLRDLVPWLFKPKQHSAIITQ